MRLIVPKPPRYSNVPNELSGTASPATLGICSRYKSSMFTRFASGRRTVMSYSSLNSRYVPTLLPKIAIFRKFPTVAVLTPSSMATRRLTVNASSGRVASRSLRKLTTFGTPAIIRWACPLRRSSVLKSSPKIRTVTGAPAGGPSSCFSTLISAPAMSATSARSSLMISMEGRSRSA